MIKSDCPLCAISGHSEPRNSSSRRGLDPAGMIIRCRLQQDRQRRVDLLNGCGLGNPRLDAFQIRNTFRAPRMMSRMTVQIPKDSIVINVESFDFARPAGQMTY